MTQEKNPVKGKSAAERVAEIYKIKYGTQKKEGHVPQENDEQKFVTDPVLETRRNNMYIAQ